MAASPIIWKIQGQSHELASHGWIMGVLNVTPDSFSDGGRYLEIDAALQHSREMIAAGARIIDIGGESSRPGAQSISETEELARVLPVLTALRQESDILLSIDTCKPAVARAAVAAGANVINDISGLRSPAMLRLIADTGVGAICMHMAGTPRDMQISPSYQQIVPEIRTFFQQRLETCQAHGIAPEQLLFDPGIGFGKTLAHNLTLLRNLPLLPPPGRPILVGVSRKSFLGNILGESSLEARHWPTIALTAWLRENGAQIIRVHHVLENQRALRMIEAIHG